MHILLRSCHINTLETPTTFTTLPSCGVRPVFSRSANLSYSTGLGIYVRRLVPVKVRQDTSYANVSPALASLLSHNRSSTESWRQRGNRPNRYPVPSAYVPPGRQCCPVSSLSMPLRADSMTGNPGDAKTTRQPLVRNADHMKFGTVTILMPG